MAERRRMKAKCEACGKTAPLVGDWPEEPGWFETCLSRHGKKHDPDGFAWWCSEECLARPTGFRKVRGGGIVAVFRGKYDLANPHRAQRTNRKRKVAASPGGQNG